MEIASSQIAAALSCAYTGHAITPSFYESLEGNSKLFHEKYNTVAIQLITFGLLAANILIYTSKAE